MPYIVDEQTGCHLWTGRLDKDGYARIGPRLAHKVAWTFKHGPVPMGYELDHKCRIRRCVNEAHLEAVTHAVNIARGEPANKTHCKNGHLLDEANTYHRRSGGRDCRICVRTRVRNYEQRKKRKRAA